jgi:hypothetical protein
MSNVRKFDEMAVVVDWIDAFKNRHLDALLDLYEDTATIECCEGGVFQGRPAVEQYWEPKLSRSRSGSFEIDALFPERDGVSLDYRGYDEKPVRTFFLFSETGKIRMTACEPIEAAAA